MHFVIITILSCLMTYFIVWASERRGKPMVPIVNIGSIHVHHTVHAIVFAIIGFVVPYYREYLWAIAFGMYLSHGFESLFIFNEPFPKAFFIFVTKNEHTSKN